MPGFIRRFTSFPTTEVLLEVEGVAVVDIAPPAPAAGVGSGAVLLFGEFEDGPFAADPENDGGGVLEAFGSSDLLAKFGGLGYDYPGSLHANASARRRNGELWNGNGFLKLRNLRFARLLLARVDSSVGSVAFSPLACISAQQRGPHALAPGDTVSITTDQGGPAASTAIAAVAATVAGAAFPATPNSGYAGGEAIRITVDDRQPVTVVFSAPHQTAAQVAARINTVMGFAFAVAAGDEVDLTAQRLGTAGRIVLEDVTPGALAAIGHVAATTAGTGNVADVNAVTDTELATVINGTAGLNAIGVVASVVGGLLRVCSDSLAGGTILVAAGPIASAVDFTPVGTAVAAAGHAGGTIPAGTRVRDTAPTPHEFVTMQTLDVPAGAAGPFEVRVRHALDDGTGEGVAGGAVTVLVDAPAFADLAVNNPAAITAALTEPQLDVRYKAAMEASLRTESAAREANHSLSARRTEAVTRDGLDNAVRASEQGMYGRKFHGRTPLGMGVNATLLEVAKFRSDRHFFTALGLRTRIPEIAEVGSAGGIGFTDDGVITVGPDAALASVNSQLPPEENPGQEQTYLTQFFAVDTFGEDVTIESYKAFRREGVCAPRLDADSGMVFQSGVTSSSNPARRNQSRRKMADFIQDSLARLCKPDSKKTNTIRRRDALRAVHESFLGGLLSESNPDLQRIDSYAVSEEGNTAELRALGIHIIKSTTRTLASLDAIVLQTEIGENAIVISEI